MHQKYIHYNCRMLCLVMVKQIILNKTKSTSQEIKCLHLTNNYSKLFIKKIFVTNKIICLLFSYSYFIEVNK